MTQPDDLKRDYVVRLHEGATATSAQVWAMLQAASEGDLGRVRELVQDSPRLLTCKYDYTAPLQLAVQQGRFDVVRFLVENGALDPGYCNHPFRDSLLTLAQDRDLGDIAEYLRASLQNPALTHAWGDPGGIDFGLDEVREKLQQSADQGDYETVRRLLEAQPELALDSAMCWGEGILAACSNGADLQMIELLMEFGATVPKISKWGARYYFKHLHIARFLLGKGMDPNHMNWRGFTLLHDMGHTGDAQKAELLLDFGADIDRVDGEYSSTPLGYAAKWGRLEVAQLLVDKGADVNKAGAPWATPLAWARKKGHGEVEAILLQAGAS